MTLKTFQITNFRCVDDSTECTLSPVTCLVGKNESGKTAILQALERLNPANPDRKGYEKLKDYPRKDLVEYDELGGDRQNVVRSVWTLDDQDVAAVENLFGKGALSGREVTVTKDYTGNQTWPDIPVDSEAILSRWITEAGTTPQETELISVETTTKDVLSRIATLTSPSEPLLKLKARIEALRDRDIKCVFRRCRSRFRFDGDHDSE
jgi:hypothetical protein